ncbi:hypothetical protein N7495_003429 [Penicillium taxi]|uniref:uncharacterized protein n=1 Tax=Penicillium taxi TaxID=168475 RepID=UPI002545460D|nr:uncharacterized protein N7495_003429 [Penicillium taxi]KAJ5902901.1 hypothetical protein N7495_003429 [Penicillium taxi]
MAIVATRIKLELNALTEPKPLSQSKAARYLQMFSLSELTCEFSLALDATTRAIHHAELEICEPKALARAIERYTGGTMDIDSLPKASRNSCLAFLAREVANEHGWLEGWKCLAEACPNSGIHHNLLEDVSLGVDVYNQIKVTEDTRPRADLEFSVVSSPGKDSLGECGLKTLGGSSWKNDSLYKECVAKWMTPKDLVMGPCPLYGWMSQCKKVQAIDDDETAYYFWTSQLLGIVDYDLDKNDSIIPGGIMNAINRTAEFSTKVTGRMRGHGWTGLLTLDQQLFTRHMQTEWAREGKGKPSRSLGPDGISPRDFAIAVYADCAALGPFACQRASTLVQSRMTMFAAVVFASLHDLVFDIGYSSRISGVAYAEPTGVFDHDLPQAWMVGMMDGLATNILLDEPSQTSLYGDNALCATAQWCLFNVRYRAWDRFVKYVRLLRRNDSDEAAAVLRRAEDGMVLLPKDVSQDLGPAWEMVVNPATASKLVPRKNFTQSYILNLETDDLVPPEICAQCTAPFREAFDRKNDEVYAVHGLPESVTHSRPVAIAVAIRRVALWAISSECCDGCACILADWANTIGDKVLVALMKSELDVSNQDWLLQNYFAGCVAFSPLRLVSITTGFDLIAKVSYESEAMGERDNISG